MDDSSIVELRSPPKLHQGKSNNTKEELLPLFLDFIDNNSQPNGRKVGSHGPLFFLSSKFDRINAPSKREQDKPDEWKRRSLVYEFNRTLGDKQSISNGTAKNWLKTHRPKHSICPKKSDYCATCVECIEQQNRHKTIAMRLQQSGDGNEEEIIEHEILSESYGLLLNEHREDAGNELLHYRQKVDECYSLYNDIKELEQKKRKTGQEKKELNELTEKIIYTLSLDYQQSKLTPHWGFSPQPGETYYLRKLSPKKTIT